MVAVPWQLKFLFVSMPLGGGCWQCLGNGVSGVMAAALNSFLCLANGHSCSLGLLTPALIARGNFLL